MLGVVCVVDVLVLMDVLECCVCWVDLLCLIVGMGLSLKGECVVIMVCGEFFLVLVEYGLICNLICSLGVYDCELVWFFDGCWIVYVLDVDGEEEIWIVDVFGCEEVKQFIDGSEGCYYGLFWLFDGVYFVYCDQC